MRFLRTFRNTRNLHVCRREHFFMERRVTGLTQRNTTHITNYIGPLFLVPRTAIVAPPVGFYPFRIVLQSLSLFHDILQFLMSEFRKKSN